MWVQADDGRHVVYLDGDRPATTDHEGRTGEVGSP